MKESSILDGELRTSPMKRRQASLAWAFAVVAMAVPLLYAMITGHVWEDYFITFKFSRNLWEGHGLVHWPGVRVHGFTSPLGVLLPSICYGITGATSYLPGLWLFRLLMSCAFAFGGIIFLGIFRRAGMAPWARGFFAVFYLFDAKSVMFSVNGMETALMLFFVALSIDAATSGKRNAWVWLGCAWGGLMLTRPDSCVFVAAIGLVDAVANRSRWRTHILFLLKAALLCALIYLPWFCWVWWYYGSPIPHTIIAKAGAGLSGSLLNTILLCLRRPPALSAIFMPPYAFFGPWPTTAQVTTWILAVVGAAYWLIPNGDPLGRRLSAIFLLLAVYLGQMPFAFPWYFPPVAVLGYGVVVCATVDLVKRLSLGDGERRVGILLLTPFAAVTCILLLMSSVQMYHQQRIIESGVRTGIGRYLAENAAPDDRVYLECLGYIGYFSERRMLDFPGLCTPEVARLRKDRGLTMATIVPELKPEWLVLRGYEADKVMAVPANRDAYRQVMVANATPAIWEKKFLPGRDYLLYDACFVVFRRVSPGDNDVPPPAL